MSEKRTISFYPDFSKNHEFIERLKVILNSPDSSIGLCYITMATSNKFCIFIEPLDSRDNFNKIIFGFDDREILVDKEDREKTINDYMSKGYSRKDLSALSELFSDFALKNHYESLLFGSKFFTEEFRNPITSSFILKYTPDTSANRYLIDGKKVSKHYSVSLLPQLIDCIKKSTIVYPEDLSLIPCNTYHLQESSSLEQAVLKIKKSVLSPTPDFVIVEYYKDYETVEGFVKSVFRIENDILVPVNFLSPLDKKI